MLVRWPRAQPRRIPPPRRSLRSARPGRTAGRPRRRRGAPGRRSGTRRSPTCRASGGRRPTARGRSASSASATCWSTCRRATTTSTQTARPVAGLTAGEEATVRVRLDDIAVQRTRRRSLRMVRARVHDDRGAGRALVQPAAPGADARSPATSCCCAAGSRRRGGARWPCAPTRSSAAAARRASTPRAWCRSTRPPSSSRRGASASWSTWRGRWRARRPERLPAWMRLRLRVGGVADSLVAVHFPRSRARGAPGAAAAGARGADRAAARPARGAPAPGAHARRAAPAGDGRAARSRCSRRCPSSSRPSSAARSARSARDLAARAPDATPAAGRGGLGQDRRGRAGDLPGRRGRRPGRRCWCRPRRSPSSTCARSTPCWPRRPRAGARSPAASPRAERERRLMALATGTAPVAVGTQALLSRGSRSSGSASRWLTSSTASASSSARRSRSGPAGDAGGAAHLLYMTATPIPRTLALTAYGDLTVSTIRGRPPGRAPVETRWVRESDREEAYEAVRAQLRAGHQAYVICPLVEGGEAAEARAATTEAERLAPAPSPPSRVGLAHGAQRTEEKRAAMADFAEGRTDLLVATTVVEVGHRRPQRHRDRRSRAPTASGSRSCTSCAGGWGAASTRACACCSASRPTEDGARRLEALTQTTDGFRLAELDLEIRGEGSILGAAPGRAPTDLRVARLGRDRRELAEARYLARRTLEIDPRLRAARAPAAARRRDRALRRPAAAAGRVRIVAGTHRGRRIAAPPGRATRPTPDRVREALFSIVGPGRRARRPRPLRRLGGARAGGAVARRRDRHPGRPLAAGGRGDPRQRASRWGWSDRARVVAPRLARRAGGRARRRAPLTACASATPPIASSPAIAGRARRGALAPHDARGDRGDRAPVRGPRPRSRADWRSPRESIGPTATRP